jgi:hypothetical protein
MQVAAANFWAEIDNPDSPWHPYLDALPSQDELVCPLVSMPREYQHLLQNEEAVSGHWAEPGMCCDSLLAGLGE